MHVDYQVMLDISAYRPSVNKCRLSDHVGSVSIKAISVYRISVSM